MGYQLKSGVTKSCGCLGKELLREQGIKNGQTKIHALNDTLNTNNKTGYKGVIWLKNRQRYVAKIKYNYKTYHLFYSDALQDCIEARRAAEDAIRNGEFEEYIERIKRQ